jgi:homocitrate synthase
MSLQQFSIIESTLREGEQFVNAFFTTEQKIEIARMLDAFGVEYIEVTTPCASPQSEKDCLAIAALGLRTKILTHTRCALEDVKRAVDTGVDGVDVVIGTSSYLREFSHGKSIDKIIETAQVVLSYLSHQNVEMRFSTRIRSSRPAGRQPRWHCRHGRHRHTHANLQPGLRAAPARAR